MNFSIRIIQMFSRKFTCSTPTNIIKAIVCDDLRMDGWMFVIGEQWGAVSNKICSSVLKITLIKQEFQILL